MITLIVLWRVVESSSTSLGELTKVGNVWQHPYSPFTVKNIIDNKQDDSSLTTTIFQGRQWDLIANISYKNLSYGPVLKPTFQYNIPISMRVDTNSQMVLNIGLKSQANNAIYAISNLVFRLRNGILIIFRYSRMNFYFYSPSSFYYGNIQFFYHKDGDIWVWMDYSLVSYRQNINFMEVLKRLCNFPGILSCDQVIGSFYYDFKFWAGQPNQIGSVQFNTSVKISRNCTTQSFSKIIGDFLLVHNVSAGQVISQFGNVSRPFNSTNIKNYIFDYSYQANGLPPSGLKVPLCPPVKVFTSLGRGKDSGIQGDNYTFPINITNKTILSTFQIEMSVMNSVSKAQVCFVITLRNDFDLLTKTFKNQSGSSAQINICLWSNVHIDNKMKSWIKIENIDYAYYNYSNQSRHFFIGSDSTLEMTKKIKFSKVDLNISKFVEKITQLSQYLIVQVKRGFRVYCGKLNFVVISEEFKIVGYSKLVNHAYKISETANEAMGTVFSIPDIGLLLRLAEILNTLDELSYFTYHNTTYNAAFAYFCDLSWGWVNSKWRPPSIIESSIGFNLSSGYEPGWVPFRQPVARFRIKGERMAFLDNCKGFLLYTVPFSVLLFVILWKLYWRFKDYKAAAVIITFSSWAYLAVSLLCDNGQYIAFRSFEQLRSFQPMSGLDILSQIFAVIVLFFAVICSVGLFLMAHLIACSLFKPPTLLRFVSSYKFLGIWTVTRFLAGFVHATIDDPLLRISLLLALQFIVTFTTMLSWSQTRFKTPHSILIFGQVVRFTLYSFICLEVIFPQITVSFERSGLLSDISSFLIMLMFFANILQILLTIAIGALVIPKDAQIKRKRLSKAQIPNKEIQKQGRRVAYTKRQTQVKATTRCRTIEKAQAINLNSEAVNMTSQKIKSHGKHLTIRNKQTMEFELYLVKKYKHQTAIKHMKAKQKRMIEIDKSKLRITRQLNKNSKIS